ncbi:pentatricopeptide repeat-containing protein At5g67570, chloroplastic [Salvia miltiorrhiza]|uniref:pentatricopeptide repeat-containing protein At5g67570, chloroplastic n=1 Tax=Salvia miltiorrhiza TaxID=226208 RepID=UPI0025AD051A|nr:pentatricopeptide repeat-containing protein At5g67570, chloroplastic [Salvia miltiorrhiza]
MEASTAPLSLPKPPPPQPDLQKISRKLLKHGVHPTPKILHNLRKKELQKINRRDAKQASKLPPPLTDLQNQTILEESHFQTIKSEYKKFTRNEQTAKLVGRPWERLDRLRLRELAGEGAEHDGAHLNPEHLRELSDIIECERDRFSWLLDDDVEVEQGLLQERNWAPRKRTEAEAIKLLIDRLSATELSVKDWKFTRTMRHSGLQYTEKQMLKIVEGLGHKGQWRHACSVVEWLYSSKEHRHFKSRFVYTKLLTVLGRARKPREALRVFNLMRGDAHIYPDMAAFHCFSVILGQAGLLKELLNVIESMKEKPKNIKNMRRKNWSPELQPDIVIFNAVLNACVPTCQWKGVSWVFQQLRRNGLRPNGASYGLAMEVMLKSGKYDLVHGIFEKMKRNGESLKALTYKVLVRAFWEEGKVDDAVRAVRDMEKRGIIGTRSVYYELARCLCFYGRWQEAILEVEKLKNLRPKRPLAVTFTGMVFSSMDGGHVQDCISLYEHCKTRMAPDIGLINAMLKVYGRNDMFLKAKEIFEETRRNDSGSKVGERGDCSFAKADSFTFGSMLETSASALQWEYFEYVYKEMTLSGHQVDQRKHSALLVEASKAGKWHLLEHAFGSILEAGEIPPLPFFTEMACQAIIQCDYEKAVNIFNVMAHAPFQVTFQEWVDFFERNRDRLDQASLIELEEELVSHELRREVTVLNLSRALEYMCGSCEDSVNSVASISATVEKVPEDVRFDDTLKLDVSRGSCMNRVLDYQSNGVRMETGVASTSDLRDEKDSTRAHPARLAENFDRDLVSRNRTYSDETESEDGEWDSDSDEFNSELIIPSSGVDDSEELDTPSAYEILQIWKKK